LFIVQPETLLRWHRQGFKLYWKYKSRAASAKPKVAAETVALIQEMAMQNRLWGAERIRGELLKLGLRVSLPHDPEVHETSAHCKATRAELEDFLTHSC
jgi:putative transposase